MTSDWTAIEGPTFGRASDERAPGRAVTRRFSSGGRLSSYTMPNGAVTSRVYDALGRVRVETSPIGAVTRYTYDAAGRLESMEDEARGATTTYERDEAGRVTATIDALGHRSETTRDIRGGVAVYEDATGREWETSDDGRTTTSTDPIGNVTTSAREAYGLPGTVTYPGGATTSSSFLGSTSIDASGEYPLSRTDEAGRDRNYTYDAFGGLDTATDLGGTDEWEYDYAAVAGGDVQFDPSSGRVWLAASAAERGVYGYSARDEERDGAIPEELDAWGHALSSVTSPEGEVTTREYDARGHLAEVHLPNGSEETREYDEDTGFEVSRTLPSGVVLDYVRDAIGRELERSGSDGSLRVMTYGPGDRMESVEDDTGEVTYDYDAAGRWTGLEHPTGATWSREHDVVDRVTSVTVTASASATPRETAYEYDDAGRLEQITDPLGGETFYTYDAAGRLSTRTLPTGVVTTWTYDARSRIDTITHRRADTTVIASVDYDRSPSGEPLSIHREDGSWVELEYDAALRLAVEEHHAPGGSIVETITYAYDGDGNRTVRTTGDGTETYEYDPGSELVRIERGGSTLATYAYDSAGRVTTRHYEFTDQDLEWDADDHVVSVTEGTTETVFDFDGAGRRVRRERFESSVSVGARRWVQAPTGVDSLESPHIETDDAGDEQRAWVFEGEHPLMRYDPATGDIVYYLGDAMGSVIGLVDDGGAVGTVHYDGFGNERSTTGTLAAVADEGDFRFQGMWLDGESGLYYVRARVYEPETGRFLSRDPVEGRRGFPESAHAYGVARESPTMFRDPSGGFAIPVLSAAMDIGRRAIATASSAALFRAVVQAIAVTAAIACTANFLLSAATDTPGPGGPCSPGNGPRLYHYTNSPDGFAGGALAGTFWTESGQLEPWEAFFDLGIGRPGMSDPESRVPTHVVSVPKDGRFRRILPLPMGHSQFINMVAIPAADLLIQPLQPRP